MELIFEIIFGVVVEIVLGVIGETLVELGFHSFSSWSNDRISRRIFAGFLYAVGGLVLGALSLKIVPLLVIGGPGVAIAYFVLAPVVSGFALCLVSWIINRGINDRGFFQMNKFVYGVIFVLSFSLTRTIFG